MDAVGFFADDAGYNEVNDCTDDHDGDTKDREFDRFRMDQLVDTLVDDPETGHEDEKGLDRPGYILHFPVSVWMLGVSRLTGYPDGNEGDQGSHEIKRRVDSFRQDGYRPCNESDHDFQDDDKRVADYG